MAKGERIMAEFCLDCWNKMNETNDSKRKYIMSEELDLCEGCGEWKPVIIMERKEYYMYKLRYLLLPFKIICGILCLIFNLLILPYLMLRDYKHKDKDN